MARAMWTKSYGGIARLHNICIVHLVMLTAMEVMGSNFDFWPGRIKLDNNPEKTARQVFSVSDLPITSSLTNFKQHLKIMIKLHEKDGLVTWFNFLLNERYTFIHVSMSAQCVTPKGRFILKQNSHILFLWSWACRTFVNMKKKRAHSNLWCNQETESLAPISGICKTPLWTLGQDPWVTFKAYGFMYFA